MDILTGEDGKFASRGYIRSLFFFFPRLHLQIKALPSIVVNIVCGLLLLGKICWYYLQDILPGKW